jgi:LacI family transcriptional regulator
MTRLVRHLIADRSRRQFVYVRGQPEQQDSIERERAFDDELMRWNLPDAYRLRGDFDSDIASASLAALLATGAEFDALVAADYLMAVAALDVLRLAGRRVPEDVSVAGFGDGEAAQAAGLTTVAANVVEQARRAARQLIGQIHGLHIRGLTVLSTELVLRATCCAEH